jgi:hypothetical protein
LILIGYIRQSGGFLEILPERKKAFHKTRVPALPPYVGIAAALMVTG